MFILLNFLTDDLPLDGSRPLVLYGYGAYGYSLDLSYSHSHIPLLQRGWTVAWAHVRGGGELGKAWHAAGRQLLKVRNAHSFSIDSSKLVCS
jgi:oligopeptidase B